MAPELLTEPTSLNGGEGLVSGLIGEVSSGEGEGEGGVGSGEVVERGENERKSTVMRLMDILNSAHPIDGVHAQFVVFYL